MCIFGFKLQQLTTFLTPCSSTELQLCKDVTCWMSRVNMARAGTGRFPTNDLRAKIRPELFNALSVTPASSNGLLLCVTVAFSLTRFTLDIMFTL